MEIRIGILHSPKELTIDTKESAANVRDAVAAALENNAAVFSLTDAKGREVIVPTRSLAYVEIGAEDVRRIGFVN